MISTSRTDADGRCGDLKADAAPGCYRLTFNTGAYLKAHPDLARAVVAAVVDAETMINDPGQTDKIVQVAVDNMKGFDPALLRAFIVKYRGIFRPVATQKQIENVETYLQGAGILSTAIPYDKVIAAGFMPQDFAAPGGK